MKIFKILKMKFILVLCLAFCAITAGDYISSTSGNYQNLEEPTVLVKFGADGALENIQKWIEEFIQKAIEAVNEIIAKLNEIVSNVQEKVSELIEQAKKKFDQILQNIEGILEDLVAQNEAAKDCVERYRPQFKAIIKNAKNDIENCKQNAFNQLQAIKSKVQRQIDGIRSEIDILLELVKECYENSHGPISAYHCIIKQFKEIKSAVTEILANAKEAVVIATKEAANIVSTTTKCISKTVSDTQSQTNNVLNKIKKCIEQNNGQRNLLLH